MLQQQKAVQECAKFNFWFAFMHVSEKIKTAKINQNHQYKKVVFFHLPISK